MYVHALLNPVLDDNDGGCTNVAPPPRADIAAMSLMLLGSSSPRAPPPPQGRQHDTNTASALHIGVVCNSKRCCMTANGLRTPLATTSIEAVAPPRTSTTSMAPLPLNHPSTRPIAPPHMSPVADKLQHVMPWSVAGANTDTSKRRRARTDARESSVKRARRDRTSKHLHSTINDLFSSVQADCNETALVEAPTNATEQMVATDTTRQRPAKHQLSSSTQQSLQVSGDVQRLSTNINTTRKLASATPHCTVAGCLRPVHELSKCAIHKGLKLCGASDCYRPVQSRGFCKSHGGGARCKHPGCVKGAISKGRCRTHGGGTRCAIPSCPKWAQRFGCCVRHSKAVAAADAFVANVSTLNVGSCSSRTGMCV